MLRTTSIRSLSRQSNAQISLRTSVRAAPLFSIRAKATARMNADHRTPARLSQIDAHLRQGNGAEIRSMSSSAASNASARQPAPSNGSGGGDDGSEPKVLTLRNGSSTTILLNRPKALNAIDSEMVHLIDEAIDASPPQNHIVLRGKGRALCSGGDVLAVVNAANSADETTRQEALTFFKGEFELDYKIATLNSRRQSPRVLISVMDGITMGGGVGLSVNAPIRIATEKTMFAMPETGIGYWPDVGVSRNLARLDGSVGTYLGMTGARISGEEAYLTGLATHFIPSSSIDESLRRLSVLPHNAKAEQIADCLDEFSLDPFNATAHEKGTEVLSKSAFVGLRRIVLDYVFGREKAEEIFERLQEISEGGKGKAAADLAKLGVADVSKDGIAEWAATTLKTLKTKAPRSLKVAMLAIRKARQNDVTQAFLDDMRLSTVFCDLSVGRDFYEGVTFTLTKDPTTGKRREGIANWNPASLQEVDDGLVEELFFGPLEKAKQRGLKMQVPKLEGVGESSGKKDAQGTRGIGPLNWERGYNKLALPSEAECEALREGSHPSAGDLSLQDDEMVKILRSVKGDKPSLEFKVKEYLERRRLQLGEEKQ